MPCTQNRRGEAVLRNRRLVPSPSANTIPERSTSVLTIDIDLLPASVYQERTRTEAKTKPNTLAFVECLIPSSKIKQLPPCQAIFFCIDSLPAFPEDGRIEPINDREEGR